MQVVAGLHVEKVAGLSMLHCIKECLVEAALGFWLHRTGMNSSIGMSFEFASLLACWLAPDLAAECMAVVLNCLHLGLINWIEVEPHGAQLVRR